MDCVSFLPVDVECVKFFGSLGLVVAVAGSGH